MTDVYMPQHSVPMQQSASDREMLELAAYERGRVAGESEAARRMESERELQSKQMVLPPSEHELQAIANLQRPDIIEINRLTNWQRASFVVGELATAAMVALVISWLDVYRGDLGWSDDYAGDNIGNIGMYNTYLFTSVLGLMFLGQAITNYRVLPINIIPGINRGWYLLMQSCAIICWCVSMVGLVRSTPETTFWSVANWCFALAFALTVSHALWSMFVTLRDACVPVHQGHERPNGLGAENWNESANRLEYTPEQTRDHSGFNTHGRSLYAPAPVNVARTGAHMPQANANLGAQVPVAPANAPRWAESPNTHAEDYWLLPRAKWAVIGFWAMGAAILMEFASIQVTLAAGKRNWPQTDYPIEQQPNYLDETSRQATLIGCLGLMTLLTVCALSYTAMPPRTTLVKNGVLQEQWAGGDRRQSISHNAETVNQGDNRMNVV